MPEYLATKPMTIAGRRVKPGDSIDMQKLKPNLRRQLIEQRKVEANHVDVSAPKRGPGRPRKER